MKYFVEIGEINKKPNTKHIILCEGKSECGLAESYLEKMQANKSEVTVTCFKGNGNLTRNIGLMEKLLNVSFGSLENFVSVGFMADSETDPAGRLSAFIDASKRFGFKHAGKSLASTGRHSENNRKVAISLSPNNNAEGFIEHLVEQEIRSDKSYACIVALDNCLDAAGLDRLSKKALAQIYISIRMNNSLCGVGRGFVAGTLNCQHQAYKNHIDFFDYLLS